MKNLISIAPALAVAVTAIGCPEKRITEKKSVITRTTSEGVKTTTTIDEKVEATPHGATRTTIEKMEIEQ